MALIPSVLSQEFRIEACWLQLLLSKRRLLSDGLLHSAKWIGDNSSARVLSACMHGLCKALELFEHAIRRGSLGSELLLLELKLLLELDVEGWLSAAVLAPGVRSRRLATSCTNWGAS